MHKTLGSVPSPIIGKMDGEMDRQAKVIASKPGNTSQSQDSQDGVGERAPGCAPSTCTLQLVYVCTQTHTHNKLGEKTQILKEKNDDSDEHLQT